jgi:hypothetical protein
MNYETTNTAGALIEQIKDWNPHKQRVTELRDLIAEFSASGVRPEAYHFSFDQLLSLPFPEKFEGLEEIWTLDYEGNALVGADLADIEKVLFKIEFETINAEDGTVFSALEEVIQQISDAGILGQVWEDDAGNYWAFDEDNKQWWEDVANKLAVQLCRAHDEGVSLAPVTREWFSDISENADKVELFVTTALRARKQSDRVFYGFDRVLSADEVVNLADVEGFIFTKWDLDKGVGVSPSCTVDTLQDFLVGALDTSCGAVETISKALAISPPSLSKYKDDMFRWEYLDDSGELLPAATEWISSVIACGGTLWEIGGPVAYFYRDGIAGDDIPLGDVEIAAALEFFEEKGKSIEQVCGPELPSITARLWWYA